jgi:hypothetical protein
MPLDAHEKVPRERDAAHVEARAPADGHQHDSHRDRATRPSLDHVIQVVAARVVVVVATAKADLALHELAQLPRSREAVARDEAPRELDAVLIQPAPVKPRVEDRIFIRRDRERHLFGRPRARHCQHP